MPRGAIRQLRFALSGAAPGDAVHFARVEFLSARGVRPHSGDGLVLGGQLLSREDGVPVEARMAGQVRHTRTEHGGWYLFRCVPEGSIVEIACFARGGHCWPERGKRVQAVRNDLEYHIDVGPGAGRKAP
jgi:hypothetical protein